MDYRRVYVPGGTYFFTVVSYDRKNIFCERKSITAFWQAIRYTRARHPFSIVANVIMPDHIHTIWTLPLDDPDFSTRWRLIKTHFTRNFAYPSANKPIWQKRFWEHLIRDETDLSNHIDYIHYNPVKHGLANSPSDWKQSSFSKFVEDGFYPSDWCQELKVWKNTNYME